jgi:hypothetical protein
MRHVSRRLPVAVAVSALAVLLVAGCSVEAQAVDDDPLTKRLGESGT